MISLVFFGALFIISILCFFTSNKYSFSSLFFLLVISIIAIILLFISTYYTEKDMKTIFSIAFFIIYLFIFTSLAAMLFSRSGRFYFFRSFILFSLISAAGFAIVFLMVNDFRDDYDLYKNDGRKSNAGVILGAAVWGGNRPSPILRERINKGFEIYDNNYVSKLVLTGGGAPDEMTEAEVSRNELIKYGVNPDDLIVEKKSISTNEQIYFVRDNLYKRNNWKRIIIVSDNFHLFRATEICRFNNMDCDAIASDTPLSAERSLTFMVKESFAVIIFWLTGIG
jgi:uncharacterized SAM-binding protein YcdF (DUF218 family)